MFRNFPFKKSANPAFVMGSLCIVGGCIGFAKRRSIPSLVAGVGYVVIEFPASFKLNLHLPVLVSSSFGAQTISSRELVQVLREPSVSTKHNRCSKMSLASVTFVSCHSGASAILLLSSAPRAMKGPVPAVLTVAATASTYYYGKTYLAHRQVNL